MQNQSTVRDRRCPVCERIFRGDTSEAQPFCSPRCRQIDLGRWLGEHYGVPKPRSWPDFDEFPEEYPDE